MLRFLLYHQETLVNIIFLTSKDVLPEKDLPEKAVAIRRFEYSLLGKELKKQTSVAKKQYQKLDKINKK